MSETTEMQKWVCHKTVHAAKIVSIEDGEDAVGETFLLVLDGGGHVMVDAQYVKKHDPKPGGYYVVYADGYKSWSPADVFEAGYTKVNP